MLKHKLLGATAGAEVLAIEDVFSTYLYNGTGAALTINNGIDLAGEGGLVWIKQRTAVSWTSWTHHALFDSARGVRNILHSSTTDAEQDAGINTMNTFNNNGFTLGSDGSGFGVNKSTETYASWTFRQAPRFFDVVTYTGTGANRTIAHDLGVVPGCIIVKRTNTTGDWQVYHRSLANTEYMVLNLTAVKATGATRWNSTTPTSTVFSLGTDATVNASGSTYVAYLFAHDPLGPSGDGSDGLIACGSYTGNGLAAGPTVSLGWEPQWLLIRNASAASDWLLFDAMRGLTVSGLNDSLLEANTADAEAVGSFLAPTATGFEITSAAGGVNGNGSQHIYIAIRRGPMREPTAGTQVFSPTLYTGTNVDNRLVDTGLLTDMAWVRQRNDTVLGGMVVGDRLRGQPYLLTGTTAAEVNDADSFDQQLVGATEYGTAFSSHVGFYVGNDVTSKLNANTTSNNHIAYSFRRAPGFFDVVAYTGTGSARTVTHNLGAVPELIITKSRSAVHSPAWGVYHANLGNTKYLILEQTNSADINAAYWNNTSPTASVFTVNTNGAVNATGATYIAYLFATLPGISKVGSYTGNGSTQTIDCGFTAGARFVLIKRTDTTDSWYVWDSARGIVAGNDPYLQLNSTAAEVTSTDHIDPANSGFTLATSFLGTNNSAGTYIYLAIA